MDKTQFKEYFQFTRNERISIILLLVLVAITGAIPAFLTNRKTEPQPSLALYEEGIKQLEELSSTIDRERGKEREDYPDHPSAAYNSSPNILFVFDPNTISEAGWKKLGVRDKTISTIRNYLLKGGRFRKPEDLSKVYGLNERDVKRLLPYVKITVEQHQANGFETQNNIKRNISERNSNVPETIDINEADTSLFIQLPGIGSKLARRIINFRDKLGGFYSVDQVGETFGLVDSVFQKLKSHLICGEIATKKININTATAADLSKHPYINWSMANAIVQFRIQHGNFETLATLEQIQLLDQGQLAKLLPYLSVE